MKKIILLLLMSNFLLGKNFDFTQIFGTWSLEANNLSKSVFIKSYSDRGEQLKLFFDMDGTVTSINDNKKYFFDIKNDLLYISDKKRYLRNALNFNKKYHVDIIKIQKSKNHMCFDFYYKSKNITGYYSKKGYKFCKILNYPIIVDRY